MSNLSHKAQRTKISVRKEYIEQNRLRLGFERKLRLQMQTLFAETGQQAQREYSQATRLIFSGRDLQQNLQKVLSSHYRAVIDAFGLRVLRNQKADGQFETLARDYIRAYGAQRVTQISNTTMAQIRRVIDAGDAEGLGNAVIGRNIFDSMRGSFSKYRSATIARTETHSAASYANHEVNASLNIPNQKKRWVSVADLRSRPSHAAANGTEVELDEDFIIGGVAMGYTGDPKGGVANVVNCRCVTLYVSPEDEVFVDDKPQAAVKPINDKPWGEVNKEEIPFHNLGGWNKDSKTSYTRNIIRAITVTKAIPNILYSKRAYVSGNGKDVSGGITDKAFDKLSTGKQAVWRHEYGHFIDHNKGTQIDGISYISTRLAPQLLNDRKPYTTSKQNNAMKDSQIIQTQLEEEKFGWRRGEPMNLDAATNYKFTPNEIEDLLKSTGLPLTYDDLSKLSGKPYEKHLSGKARDFIRFIANARAGYVNKHNGWLRLIYTSTPEGLYFADYLEAISNASIGFGHGKSYLSKFRRVSRGVTVGHTTEAMANYTSLLGGQNADVWRKLMESTAPTVTKGFDEIFEEIGKTQPQ